MAVDTIVAAITAADGGEIRRGRGLKPTAPHLSNKKPCRSDAAGLLFGVDDASDGLPVAEAAADQRLAVRRRAGAGSLAVAEAIREPMK